MKIKFICKKCEKEFFDYSPKNRVFCSRQCKDYANIEGNMKKEEIIYLYNQGLSTPHIAKKLNYSTNTVYSYLKNNNVHIRTQRESLLLMHKKKLLNPPWNKSLTKETDDRIRKQAEGLVGHEFTSITKEKIKNTLKKKHTEGILSNSSPKQLEAIEKFKLGGIKTRFKKMEEHIYWLGGISFESYTPDFNISFKEKIKERDKFTCKLCNLFEQDSIIVYKKKLCVHHIDYIKKNSFPQNCISLCSRCNSIVNKDREIWTKHFQDLLKKLYNYEYTQDQKIILDFTGVDDNTEPVKQIPKSSNL